MKSRNLVGACLEMSQSEAHPRSRKAQIFGPGEKNKLIGAARILPRTSVQMILRRSMNDTLPLRQPVGLPLNYGCEATVFDIPKTPDTPRKVLKLYHSNLIIDAVTRQFSVCQKQMQKYFPDLVEPASVFVYQGRFADEPCMATVQAYVSGNCLFEEGKYGVRSEEVIKLYEGTQSMARERGVVPDFSGGRNVLVDSEGHIRIVDCGYPVAVDDIDLHASLRQNLDWLVATAQSLQSDTYSY